jgi:hypothetical protein
MADAQPPAIAPAIRRSSVASTAGRSRSRCPPAPTSMFGRRNDGHRGGQVAGCRAEGAFCTSRPIACMAAGVHARRRLERKVVQAGRDKRTRLRFSRISIARCADVIRSSASAWGPLSQSVHRVTGARATDQRPCARDLRPGGVGSTAESLRREIADANGQPGSVWQAWTDQAGTAVARARLRHRAEAGAGCGIAGALNWRATP